MEPTNSVAAAPALPGASDAFPRWLVWPRHDGFRAVGLVANGQPAIALCSRQGDAPYRAHSLHVLAGSGKVETLVLYTPPLAAALFPAFGLAET